MTDAAAEWVVVRRWVCVFGCCTDVQIARVGHPGDIATVRRSTRESDTPLLTCRTCQRGDCQHVAAVTAPGAIWAGEGEKP